MVRPVRCFVQVVHVDFLMLQETNTNKFDHHFVSIFRKKRECLLKMNFDCSLFLLIVNVWDWSLSDEDVEWVRFLVENFDKSNNRCNRIEESNYWLFADRADSEKLYSLDEHYESIQLQLQLDS